MPWFGKKKTDQKQEYNLGNTSNSLLETKTSVANQVVGRVTTSEIVQSSSHTTTTTTFEKRISTSGSGTLFESSTFPNLELTRHSILENHSDNNLRSSFNTRQQILPRTAFGTTTYASYPSRSSVSPVAGSLFTTGDGQKRGQNIPRLSLPPPTSPVLLTNNSSNLNNNAPKSASVAVSTTPSVVPIYKHSAPKRGKVLIINNIKFLSGNNEERKGAKKDQKELKRMWQDLFFDVEECKDLKHKQMNEKLKAFSRSSFQNYNMSIVIMMSHGSNRDPAGNAIKGGYTEIFGTDDIGLPIDDVLNHFSKDNANVHLQGKPKIFIFQCCRGDLDQSLKTDSRPIKPVIRSHEDMLIAWSTIPGFLSNRDPQNGTWYIQNIIKVFKNHYKTQHIEQLLKLVDSELSKMHPQYKQTSSFENRGFNKDCYLVPRI